MVFQPISAPHFGGCRNTQTGQITSCAVKPSHCLSEQSQYVEAHEVEGGICNSPSKVSTGRCTSSIDNKVCTSDASACEIRSAFQSTDTCNIIQDTNSDDVGASTLYPHCGWDVGNRQCVLSEEDCGDDMFYPLKSLIWVDPCTCDQVPTGMCYLTDVSPITADSSFCANGPYDCPDDTYSFMTAKDLFNMREGGNAPRICNLCRKVDIVKEEAQHDRIVESGGCYSTSNILDPEFIKCALQSTDCPSSTTIFKSSVEMREMNHVPCKTDELKTGRCASSLDEIDCTGDASACYLPARFESDSSCTLHSNVNTKEPSYFGMCRGSRPAGKDWRDQRCVWQESECDPINEIWWYGRLPAKDGSDWLTACTCEHVEVGGCAYMKNGSVDYHCAVSENGCSDPTSYLTATEMKDMGIHCKLCQPRRDAFIPTLNPTSNGHGDILDNGGKIPGTDDEVEIYDPPKSSNNRGNNAANSTSNGSVALGLFFSFLIVSIPTVGLLMYRRRNAAKQRVGSEQTQGSNAVLPPSPVADKNKEII